MTKEIRQGEPYWKSLWLIGVKMMIGCEDWMICRILIEVDDYRNQSMRGNEWDVRPCGHVSPTPWKLNLWRSSVAAILKAMGSSGSVAWGYWLEGMTV